MQTKVYKAGSIVYFAGDPAVLYADISKVKNVLKWKPEKSLENSIKSAYLWKLKKDKLKE